MTRAGFLDMRAKIIIFFEAERRDYVMKRVVTEISVCKLSFLDAKPKDNMAKRGPFMYL